MGSGDRQQQFEGRFGQGNPHAEYLASRQECVEREGLPIVLGDYRVEAADEGYVLLHNEEELGRCKELLQADKKRALFKLDKGMLLEVTPAGVKEILSQEKARVHGIIASDGSLYINPERRIYEIKLVCESMELIDVFREDFKKVYEKELHFSMDRGKYPRARISSKEIFNDLVTYGAKEGHCMWRVPREHLDHEGTREWLKMFMAGDGSIGYERGKARVRFFSMNRDGLEQIQRLLDEEFGITSKLSMRDRTDKPKYSNLEYVLGVRSGEDTIRYIGEIGSYKQLHQDNIRKALGE